MHRYNPITIRLDRLDKEKRNVGWSCSKEGKGHEGEGGQRSFQHAPVGSVGALLRAAGAYKDGKRGVGLRLGSFGRGGEKRVPSGPPRLVT